MTADGGRWNDVGESRWGLHLATRLAGDLAHDTLYNRSPALRTDALAL